MVEHALHGQVLGHYRLEDVIGVGSFATVYRAVDERLGGTVVVKMLAENHSLNPEIRERFIAEGRSLRRVEGAQVITIYDMGESERQQPYLVLEYAARGTLQDRVQQLWQQGWRISRGEMLRFARQLAGAVEAVHRAQLVHRDLSPGNLLLTDTPTERFAVEAVGPGAQVINADERLVIADLGLCKDLAVNSGLTVAGGTAGFRPPEQHSPGIVDTRADIWAMSAVVQWISRDADFPRAFRAVLRRGLDAKPQRRQADVASWLAEVEQALAPPRPAPEPPVEQTPAPTPEPATSRRRWWLIGIVSVVVLCAVLAGGLTGFLLGSGSGEPPAQGQGVSVAVDGPTEIAVGEPGVFTADVEGANSWAWVLPTDRYVADDQQVTLTPTAAGTAELLLRARAPDGTELQTRHTVRVVD